MPQPLQMVFNVKTTNVIKQPVQSTYVKRVKPVQVKNTFPNFMGLMGLVKSKGCSSCQG